MNKNKENEIKEKDIINKLSNYIDNMPDRTGQKMELSAVRLPDNLLQMLLEDAEKYNVSMSRMIRAAILMTYIDKFQEIKEWLFNDDNRTLEEVLNNG